MRITSTLRAPLRSLHSFASLPHRYLAPITHPHTRPLSSPPPAHSLSPPFGPTITPISAVPTTQLTIDRLRVLCCPVFEEEKSLNPMIAWAGIFGSVQSGTQCPDSDVDFVVGYAAGAGSFRDVYSDELDELDERLQEILGREVKIIEFIQDNYDAGYFLLNALLTAETIWGDPLWVHSSRKAAGRLLMEGYETSKKVLHVASRFQKRLPSSQAEFVSPENKALQLSILEDALFVITTLKNPDHCFYRTLRSTLPWFLAKEDAIRAAIEGEVASSGDLGDIWDVLSDRGNVALLKCMVQAAEETLLRGGLVW